MSEVTDDAPIDRATGPASDAAGPSPEACVHGGAFFEAIGDAFDDLSRRERIVNADVLDAWFPPSPKALAVLREHLDWLVRTSPPTHAEGLSRTVSRVRGVPESCLLTAAGSSDLIFLAMREWLTPSSRALVLDPTYGEYEHVLKNVVGCRVDRFPLARSDGYELDIDRLGRAIRAERYDVVGIVNPNSPTGRHAPREALEAMLARVPASTRVWIDETYIDYAASSESLERFAASRPNVIVSKSLSKAYALSGLRAAYLCADAAVLAPLRRLTPPWAVSLPAQVAAVKALEDVPYYASRWAETAVLRESLAADLRQRVRAEVVPSSTNFLLAHLPDDAPTAAELVDRLRADGLYIRDASAIGSGLGPRAIRVAVKDARTNGWMVDRIAAAVSRT